jgi:prepilin-type N-terminal cleavage/methylation domain-containing protein
MSKSRQIAAGFSLIELMMTVAILGLVSAIAFPMYRDYVVTARQGVMRENIESIRLFEESFRLEERAYIAGTYSPADPDNANGLKNRVGWEPRTEKDTITYVVTCGTVSVAPRCTVAGGYKVVGTDSDVPGSPMCVSFGAACP